MTPSLLETNCVSRALFSLNCQSLRLSFHRDRGCVFEMFSLIDGPGARRCVVSDRRTCQTHASCIHVSIANCRNRPKGVPWAPWSIERTSTLARDSGSLRWKLQRTRNSRDIGVDLETSVDIEGTKKEHSLDDLIGLLRQLSSYCEKALLADVIVPCSLMQSVMDSDGCAQGECAMSDILRETWVVLAARASVMRMGLCLT